MNEDELLDDLPGSVRNVRGEPVLGKPGVISDSVDDYIERHDSVADHAINETVPVLFFCAQNQSVRRHRPGTAPGASFGS